MNPENYDEAYVLVDDFHNFVSQSKPTKLQMLNILLGEGLMISKICFLNIEQESELQMFGSLICSIR